MLAHPLVSRKLGSAEIITRNDCSKESGINIFPEREIKKKVATEHSGDPNRFLSTEYHHTM